MVTPSDARCRKRRGEPTVTAVLGRDALGRQHVGSAPVADTLRGLDTPAEGLSSGEAAARLVQMGPNFVRTQRVSAIAVLRRQLDNAVLGLLAVTAVLSFFLSDSTQALIIGIILLVSIGLGFVNEYRAEHATAALHSRVHHNTAVRRDGRPTKVDVNALGPGDVIRLELGGAEPTRLAGQPHRTRGQEHHAHRRVARFSHPGHLPSAA